MAGFIIFKSFRGNKSTNMKIGIDARFVGPGGTGLGKYTEKLIVNLAAIDRANQYVIFLRKTNWDYLSSLPKNFAKILADVLWYSFVEQIKLPKIFTSQNLDILHIPHFNVPILYRGRFVVTIHDLIHHQFAEYAATTKNPFIFKLKRFIYKKVIDYAVSKSQKIITPSGTICDEIVKTFGIDSQKIVVAYEAAEEEYFLKARNSSIKLRAGPSITLRTSEKLETRNYLLYVGNAYPHKNLERLLDAFKILISKSQTPTLKLVIVSPRDIFSKRLKTEIAKRNLEKNVKLLGYQEAGELAKLFGTASAYVFPSLAEGFGIPGLNAMAAGLPVAASNIPTLKEVYGDAALYFDPKDSGDIAEKINKILADEKFKLDLIKKGQKQVKKYSWRRMAEETLKVYESILK